MHKHKSPFFEEQRLCSRFSSANNRSSDDRDQLLDMLDSAAEGNFNKQKPQQRLQSSTEALHEELQKIKRSCVDWFPARWTRALVGAAFTPVGALRRGADKIPIIGTLLGKGGEGLKAIGRKVGLEKVGEKFQSYEGKIEDTINKEALRRIKNADATWDKRWHRILWHKDRAEKRIALNHAKKLVIQDLRGVVSETQRNLSREEAEFAALIGHLENRRSISAQNLNSKKYFTDNFSKALGTIEEKIKTEEERNGSIPKQWESAQKAEQKISNALYENNAPPEEVANAVEHIHLDKARSLKALIEQHIQEPYKQFYLDTSDALAKTKGYRGIAAVSDASDRLSYPEKAHTLFTNPPRGRPVTFKLGGDVIQAVPSFKTSMGIGFKILGKTDPREAYIIVGRTGTVALRRGRGRSYTLNLGENGNDFFRNLPQGIPLTP